MIELNAQAFKQMIMEDVPVVVDFWADWCMPCKIFAPVVEEISDELDGKASFGKVNVDEEQGLAVEYNIASIPTLLILKGGEEKERLVGIKKKEDVIAAISRHF